MKTQIVKFSYGTVKNASLQIPAEAHCIHDIVVLIRQSYLDYAFRPENRCLVSDEVLTSSIGHSNFFTGALLGWETRMSAKDFAALKQCADDDIGMATAVAKYRMPNASRKAILLRASENTVLTEDVRAFLVKMSEMPEIKE